jgi:3-hydroxybutyryl-CoA dehydrogenase
MQTIERVGVIGAGTMGNGIAQACATSGLDVVMLDVEQSAVDRGLAGFDACLARRH